jgi:hypothetical protein
LARKGARRLKVTDEERDHLWPKLVAAYPGYDFYQRNANGREIPVVIGAQRDDAQRPADAAPAITARAVALPLDDDSHRRRDGVRNDPPLGAPARRPGRVAARGARSGRCDRGLWTARRTSVLAPFGAL